MEPADSGAACGFNLLILKEAAPAWRAGLGPDARIPQKPSKNHPLSILPIVNSNLTNSDRCYGKVELSIHHFVQ